MSLTPGTTLGPYRVLDKLGEGGMGAVYRAHDARLNRDVAIKVSGERFTERFEREAKAIAALNHTNVCHLYDVGPDYLVMELVQGESLRGPLALDQALPLLQQLVDGIEAAHEKGITHRDLKPANIRVTPDGIVKILDFGLAKLTDGAGDRGQGSGDREHLSQAPTMASPTMLTGAGMILGTAAYMAPEQARGKAADQRADIWAFGAVVYELLTGAPAFPGETVADILGAVLHKEPDWSQVPGAIRPLLQWCLEKDRRKRLQAIGDARRWLEQSSSSQAEVAPAKRPVTWMVATGTAVVALIAAVSMPRSAMTPSAATTRLLVAMPDTHELFTGGGGVPAISADGHTLVYVAVARDGGRRLYRRALDQLDAVEIRVPVLNPVQPSLSPDGKWVSFSGGVGSTEQWRQFRVGIDGGNFEAVTDAVEGNYGSTWLDNDTLIFTGVQNGLRRLFRVTLGGLPTPLTTPVSGSQPGAGHMYPQATGSLVAYVLWSRSLDTAKVVVRSLETGDERVVLDGTGPRILPTGHLLFAKQNDLWAARFDTSRLGVDGEPVRVLGDVQVNSGGLALYSTSDNGTLVYVPGMEGTQRTAVWVDRQGREAPINAPPTEYATGRVSPDGSQLVFDTDRSAGDLSKWDERRAINTRLTSDAASGAVEWTPDGRSVVFASGRGGVRNLYVQRADGVGGAERLLSSPDVQTPLSFTPDGRLLFRNDARDGVQLKLVSLSVGARQATSVMPVSPGERNHVLSSDGKWIAFESDESGQAEVYVRPFPNVNAGKWQVSSGGGSQPLWSGRSDELYFEQEGGVVRVSVKTGVVPEFGSATSIVPARYYLVRDGRRRYDISPDGERFLMIKQSVARHLVVVQDWFAEIERLVP